MIRSLLPLLLILVGCEFTFPTNIIDHINLLGNVYEVGFVTCGVDSLSIEQRQTAQCQAINPDSTHIEPFLVEWVSSQPSAILVTTYGQIRVGDVASDSVYIIATGTNGVSAHAVIKSYDS